MALKLSKFVTSVNGYYSGIIELDSKIVINNLIFEKLNFAPSRFDNKYFSLENGNSIFSAYALGKGQISKFTNDFPSKSTIVNAPNQFYYNDIINAKAINGNTISFSQSSRFQFTHQNEEGDIEYYKIGGYWYDGQAVELDANTNEFLWTVYQHNDAAYCQHRTSYDINTKQLNYIHNYKLYNSNSSSSYLFSDSAKENFYDFLAGYRGDFYIRKYNKTSKTTSVIKSVGYATSIVGKAFPTQILRDDINTDSKRFYLVRHTGYNSIEVQLITIDTTNGTVTNTLCTLNNVPSQLTKVVFNNNKINIVSFLHYDDVNNKIYLSFYNTSYKNDNINNQPQYYIHTFEIDSANPTNLTYVGNTKIGFPVGAYIALDQSFNKILLPGMTDSIVLTFINGQQNITNLNVGLTYGVLYDSLGRIFLETENQTNRDQEAYFITPDVPNTVDITFEQNSYNYTGSDIQTFVKISVYDYNNQRIQVTGDLKILSNNAEFLDGSKIKQVTTSTSGDVQVDLKITAPGVVDIVFDVQY